MTVFTYARVAFSFRQKLAFAVIAALVAQVAADAGKGEVV